MRTRRRRGSSQRDEKRRQRHLETDQSRLEAILESDAPLLVTIEEAYAYCRKLLGIGRPGFQKAIRPHLKLFPLYIDRNRFKHFRVHFPTLRKVVQEKVEEAMSHGLTYDEIRLLRKERRQ